MDMGVLDVQRWVVKKYWNRGLVVKSGELPPDETTLLLRLVDVVF